MVQPKFPVKAIPVEMPENAIRVALLINFNSRLVKDGIKRFIL